MSCGRDGGLQPRTAAESRRIDELERRVENLEAQTAVSTNRISDADSTELTVEAKEYVQKLSDRILVLRKNRAFLYTCFLSEAAPEHSTNSYRLFDSPEVRLQYEDDLQKKMDACEKEANELEFKRAEFLANYKRH